MSEAVDPLFISDPLSVLQKAFEVEAFRVETRRAELAEAREAILRLAGDSYKADHAAGPSGWETLPADMTPTMVERLTAATADIMRVFTMTLDTGPGLDENNIREGQRRIMAGLTQRVVYPLSLLDSTVGQRWLRSWSDVGEEQRFIDQPPSEFAIFGRHTVMAVSEWGNPESPYVVIRDPMLVAAFTAYFDLAFDRGLPLPSQRAADDEDRRLLGLLAMGIKDEAIARYLGWSLRTVRRRVARVMAELGVETRFQLGVAAARADLVTLERVR